jgi:hypothetical protein
MSDSHSKSGFVGSISAIGDGKGAAPGSADETEIEATLTPAGDRTRLVIEKRCIPIEHLPGHGAGWQAHVEDLAAHERQDWRTRWLELAPSYDAFRGELQ